jgi:hypothetical protein
MDQPAQTTLFCHAGTKLNRKARLATISAGFGLCPNLKFDVMVQTANMK